MRFNKLIICFINIIFLLFKVYFCNFVIRYKQTKIFELNHNLLICTINLFVWSFFQIFVIDLISDSVFV